MLNSEQNNSTVVMSLMDFAQVYAAGTPESNSNTNVDKKNTSP